MTTHEERVATYTAMLELIEFDDLVLDNLNNTKAVPFDRLTPDLWAVICEQVIAGAAQVVEMHKESILLGRKIVDNDAANAHLRTVLEAEDD